MRARSRWRLPESGKRSPLVRTEESRSPAGSAGEPSLSMQLRNPEEMAAYLDAWLAEAPDDASGIARALGDIARAKGMTQVARDAGLSRESLYKGLCERPPLGRQVRHEPPQTPGLRRLGVGDWRVDGPIVGADLVLENAEAGDHRRRPVGLELAGQGPAQLLLVDQGARRAPLRRVCQVELLVGLRPLPR